MNALLLPGNSSRHAEWVENLKQALSSHFETTLTQHYRHWQTGEQSANVDYEITIAEEKTTNLTPYIIIAKSIGTAIATKGAAEKKLHPEKLILLGLPVNGGVSSDSLLGWLKLINIPIIIVQNTTDPLGAFKKVKTLLEKAGNNLTFVELPGDTLVYLDFEAIAKLI